MNFRIIFLIVAMILSIAMFGGLTSAQRYGRGRGGYGGGYGRGRGGYGGGYGRGGGYGGRYGRRG
ncbi:uncharacterized protein LOC142646038 [Dermatophagoides pteronyssinus]